MGFIKTLTKARSRHECAVCGEAILTGAKYERNQNENSRYDNYGICLRCREYLKFHKEMSEHCEQCGIEPYNELHKWQEKYANTEIKTKADKMLLVSGYEKVEDDLFFVVYERKEILSTGKYFRVVTLFFDKKQMILYHYALLYDKQNKYCFDYSDFFFDSETLKGIAEKMEELENDPERWNYNREEDEGGRE